MHRLFLTAVFLSCALSWPAAADALSFNNAPIACGRVSQYKTCTADFDGRKLRISSTNPEGKKAIAVYSKCELVAHGLHCAEGEFQAVTGKGALGPLSIGIRDGKPFPQ